MKKILIAASLSLPLLASAQNLLTNGSFELGLSGWTVSQGVGAANPVSVMAYDSLPGAYGEVVPTDSSSGNRSPDSIGTQGVYFVEDVATQTLAQTFTVATAGLYNVGISAFLPNNGYANAGDAAITVTLGALTTNANLSSLPGGVWLAYNVVVPLSAGSQDVSLAFAPSGGLSKDLVLDRAYVVAVPEPGTYALFIAGLGMVGFMAKRRRAA